MKTSGCELADANGTILKTHEEASYFRDDKTILHYFRINGDPKESDICYTLSPGTRYKFRSYVIYNGKKYYSSWLDFKTPPSSTPAPASTATQAPKEIRFTFENTNQMYHMGQTDAQFGYIWITCDGANINDVKTSGCELADANGTILKTHEEASYYRDGKILHYFRINGDPNESDICYTLSPDTTYKFRSYVIYNGKKYYSSWLDFKTRSADVTPTPTPVATATPTPAPQIPTGEMINRYGIINFGNINFRNGPSTSAKRLGTLTQNTLVYLILTEDNDKGELWTYVEVDGQRGYIMTQYLSMLTREDSEAWNRSQASPAPVYSYQDLFPTSAPTAAPTFTPAPTPVNTDSYPIQQPQDATGQPTVSNASAQLTASASGIGEDGIFTVTLSLSRNPGIGGITISSDFASSGISLVNTEATGIAGTAQVAGASRFSMISGNEITGDGQFVRLTFNANGQEEVTIRFNVDLASRTDGSIVTISGTSVSAQRARNNRKPGDANEDGVVDIVDAMMILRYDCGWNVTVNMSNSDVNGDNAVDIVDAMMILRYDCGWNVNLI